MNTDKKTIPRINPPKAKKPRAKAKIDDDDDSRPTPTWVPTPAWVEALTLDIEEDE